MSFTCLRYAYLVRPNLSVSLLRILGKCLYSILDCLRQLTRFLA